MGLTVSTYSMVKHSGVYVCGTCEDNQEVLHKGDEAPRWVVSRQVV